MLLVPRSYQTECVHSFFDYFMRATGNPVAALPTGTGKSVIIAMFLEQVFRYYPNQKILVLTHVKELIQQNYGKLMAVWPGAPAGINSSALGKRDIHDRIVFAGIQSVAKSAHLFGHVDIIIIDEAHLVSPTDNTMYQGFIRQLRQVNPYIKVMGLTATPWRMGQGHICGEGSLFTDVCFDITGVDAFNRLIAEGYLAPLIAKRTKTLLDVDGVHMRGGEFIAGELQAAVNKDEITRAALAEAVVMGQDRKKWLIFAAGTDHSDSISQMLEAEYGIVCPSVHSKAGGRDEAIEALRNGDVRAVVNNNILTTGVDVPDLDFIVVLRPTGSAVLWVQMLGRGTRPFAGKDNCLVGDFAGNTKRLGPINDPVIPRKKGEKAGTAPVRECERCETYNHASARTCINCGFVFPPPQTKITTFASTEEVLKGELPETQNFKVDHISYAEHQKLGKPPGIRVTYYSGLNLTFSDFVLPEHEGWGARNARHWWKLRSDEPMPQTTAAMLEVIDKVKAPTHLRVWTNKKPYPQIMNYCFDGTAFGTQEASDSDEGPTINAQTKQVTNFQDRLANDPVIEDDDIPF